MFLLTTMRCFQFGRSGFPSFHRGVELLFQLLIAFIERAVRSALGSCHLGFEDGDGSFGLSYFLFAIGYAAFQFFEFLVQFLLLFVGKLGGEGGGGWLTLS